MSSLLWVSHLLPALVSRDLLRLLADRADVRTSPYSPPYVSRPSRLKSWCLQQLLKTKQNKNLMPLWSTHADLISHTRWRLSRTCPRPSQGKSIERSSELKNGKHQDKARPSETPKALTVVLSSPFLPGTSQSSYGDIRVLIQRRVCDFCLCLVITQNKDMLDVKRKKRE